MSVVYDVAPFSETTSSQKGETCWYYSAKMLLKFHDLFDRGAKEPENPLQALHTLRKMLTATKTGNVRDIYSQSKGRLRHPLDAKLVELEKEKKSLPPVGDDPIAKFLRERGEEALANQIGHVKSLIQQDTDPSKKKRVIELIEKQIETEESRFDFLSFALPHIKFRLIPKPENAGMLEESLRQFGPLYASGSLTISKTIDDSSGKSGSNERVVAVRELRGGGRHAIVIAGVTEQEEVFYKDPNKANELKCIHFRQFIRKQRRLHLIAIDCATRAKAEPSGGVMNGSCVHCTQRLITQKVVPPVQVTR